VSNRTWTTALALLASGCASIAQPDAPAHIVEPDAASRAELRATIARALQRSDVLLADDALTRTSTLLIERTAARDSTGQRISGRDYEAPEQFELVLSAERCTLIHARTGQRYELRAARCEPQGG
jgi:hypothetical protein